MTMDNRELRRRVVGLLTTLDRDHEDASDELHAEALSHFDGLDVPDLKLLIFNLAHMYVLIHHQFTEHPETFTDMSLADYLRNFAIANERSPGDL